MPIKRSAKKALAQSLRKQVSNNIAKKNLKEELKKFKVLVSSDPKAAEAVVPSVQKALDKAAKKRIIEQSVADRKKALIMTQVNNSKRKVEA